MPEAAAIRDFLRSCADRVGQRNMKIAGLSTIALPAQTTGNRQMAPQTLTPSVGPIDILIDGLVAHGLANAPMTPQIPRNLFWRPGG